MRSGIDPKAVGSLSLYELLSTTAALETLREEEERGAKGKPGPSVSEEDWDQSMDVIRHLAQFDPSLRLE